MWFSLSAPNSGDGFEFGEPYIFFFDRDLKTSPNFPIHHKGFEHKKLRDLLRKHRGGFILSYNDCPNNQRVV